LALATAAYLYSRASRIPETIEVRSYAGSRGDETPREVVLAGETFAVEEVERAWNEERNGERLRVFRLRLSGGRRVQVSLGDAWQLDGRRS
jgi:hypothetical protein